MLDKVAEEPMFIKRTITGDEMRVYEYDVESSDNIANGAPKINQTR